MDEQAPIQPLPDWMSRTYLSIGPSSSTLVTLVFPQTYSGPPIDGLTWPWVSAGETAAPIVSIVGFTGLTAFTTPAPTSADSSRPPTSQASTPPTSSAVPSSAASVPPTATLSSLIAPSSGVSPSIASTATGVITPTSITPPTPVSSVSAASVTSASVVTSLPSSAQPGLSTEAGSSTSGTASPSTTVTQSHSSGLSAGVIVAIVVGSVAFAAGVLLLLLACYLRRRKRKRSRLAATPTSGDENDEEDMREVPGEGSTLLAAGTTFDPVQPAERQGLMRYTDAGPEEENAQYSLPSGAAADPRRQSATVSDLRRASETTKTDSTGSRVSARQFATRRHPSSESKDPGGGTGPGGAAGSGRGGGSDNTGTDSTPLVMTDEQLFDSLPPRSPSRTRTVATQAADIGLGRPSAIPIPARRSGSATRSRKMTGSSAPSSVETPQSGASFFTAAPSDSHRVSGGSSSAYATSIESGPSSAKRLGSYAPRASPIEERDSPPRSTPEAAPTDESYLGTFLSGLGFLAPFLGGPPAARTDEEQRGGDAQPAVRKAKFSDPERLPPSITIARDSPDYRRVTTTAAAYATQDLMDLARRQSIPEPSSADVESHHDSPHASAESEDEELTADETRSFIGPSSPSSPGPPSKTYPYLSPAAPGRWSRATLGQPIRRISGISTLTLSDAISEIRSVSSSLKARSQRRVASEGALHSRAASQEQEERGLLSPTSSMGRGSAGHRSSRSNSSKKSSRSAHSHVGSGSRRSENSSGVASSGRRSENGSGSRRSENGSGGSAGSGGRNRPRRANRSEMGLGGGVTEAGEVVPPVPTRPAGFDE